MYDADGHETRATGAVYGTETTQYDADGRVNEVDEPATGSITSPARLVYDYYPNGQRKDLNVASSAFTASPFLSYAYRNDGMRSRLHVGYGQSPGDFTWSYTDGGRTMSQADPYTGTAMPSPQSPVAPGTLYAAKAWTYDGSGQLSSITLPQTLAYQSIAHDDEGSVVSWMGSSSINGPASMSFGITVRGENVGQSLGPVGISVHATRIANGAAIPVHSAAHATGSPPTIPWSVTIDPVNAIVASTSQDQYVRNSDPSGPTWEDCGSMTSSHGYDAASRMVSSIATMNVNTGLADCAIYDAGPDTTPLYYYDAENHHITAPTGSPGTNGIQWSPSGHAYNIGGWTLHYDGDRILFITDGNGALTQAKVELLGKYYPSTNTVTVSDRGLSDQNVSQHNGSFYGGISLGATMYRPPGPTSSSQSVPYIFYGSTNDTTCTPPGPSGASCEGGASFDYVRPEGFIYGALTFQGVRAVDEASGQWTTPDAYAGDVHDPMSQKAFMWDRNNPYAYQDPSGFAPHELMDCGCFSTGYETVAAAEERALEQSNQSAIIIAFRPKPDDDDQPRTKKGGSKTSGLSKFERDLLHAFHLDGAVSKLPKGTVGINESEYTRWHARIKRRAGIGAADNAYINPKTQDLWIQNRDGSYSNLGNVNQYFQADKK